MKGEGVKLKKGIEDEVYNTRYEKLGASEWTILVLTYSTHTAGLAFSETLNFVHRESLDYVLTHSSQYPSPPPPPFTN